MSRLRRDSALLIAELVLSAAQLSDSPYILAATQGTPEQTHCGRTGLLDGVLRFDSIIGNLKPPIWGADTRVVDAVSLVEQFSAQPSDGREVLRATARDPGMPPDDFAGGFERWKKASRTARTYMDLVQSVQDKLAKETGGRKHEVE